ncbi:hypothetical protein Patl1_27171 [Pistacia atlantica]|uniref:Uncharacterized protein n=1 Tax=Pistacia atlantica TaxID=434234 RepID=A0ACC1AZP3_9ROSI|nr:hypothetical protein Patl1_27171 [Pistacia atlantica]
MTEQESEKFHAIGLPELSLCCQILTLIFVLPDSYIDPQNREYGGDKYINGTIIPRPPPIQRNTGGRFRDRNRNFDRPPRYNQQGGPMQNQQNHPQNNSWQGDGRNHGALQNYPLQQKYPPQQNFPPQQNYPPKPPGQGERGGNYNQGERGNYYPPQGDQSGKGERNFAGNNSNYAPRSHSGTYGQGTSSNYGQSYGGQGENQRFSAMEQGNVQG